MERRKRWSFTPELKAEAVRHQARRSTHGSPRVHAESMRGKCAPFWALLLGLWLGACGGVPEAGLAPGDEPLGTQESALCVGLSVTTLTTSGISSYQGELAGSGSWAVSSGANGIRLEYYLDGVLLSVEERLGTSGTWYFSGEMTCGTHTFQVRGYPMVVDSGGTRTTCYSGSKSVSQSVTETCGVRGSGFAWIYKSSSTVSTRLK